MTQVIMQAATQRDSFVPRYRPLLELGRGGMARVYLAESMASGLRKLVVLKVLNQELASDPEMRDAFIREAEISARLNHPGIVNVYEVFEQGSTAVMVMQHLEGMALSEITSRLSGLRIGDSQCGYTALSRKAAEQIPLSELWPRYGYPGHLLLTLAQAGLRVSEVPVRPIYQGERSGLRPWHVLYIAGVVCARALTLKLRRLGLQSAAAEGQR